MQEDKSMEVNEMGGRFMRRFVIAMGIAFIVSLAIAKCAGSTVLEMAENAVVGCAASIVASAIYAILSFAEDERKEREYKALLSDKCDEYRTSLQTYQNQLIESNREYYNSLEGLKKEVIRNKKLVEEGLISIRRKSYYDKENEFWKNMIINSNEHLDLIGHALSNWFTEEYRNIFLGKIKEMAKNRKKVRLIVVGNPYEEDVMKKALKNETIRTKLSQTEKTYFFLYQLIKEMPSEFHEYVECYVVNPEEVTYLYIRTDNACYISPYLSGIKNDPDSFLIEFDVSAERAQCFIQQFGEFISNYPKINWIS